MDFDSQAKYGLFKNFAEFSKFRKNRFSSYYWDIFKSDNILILGDICTLAYLENEQRYEPAIFVDTVKIHHVLLPITSHLLIYGFDTKLTHNPTLPSIETINKNMAELSREFIVAKSEHDFPNDILNLIGSRAEFTKEKFG